MNVTVIISYYKALDNLKVILLALNNQSANNFEVIVSEDDNNEETRNFINNNKNNYSYNITHLHQNKDDGFRKNEMLNKSIINSKNEFIAFIDGDCVPHKHFVREYSNNAKEGYFFSGRAVLLDENISNFTKQNITLKKINFITLLFSKTKKLKDSIYFPLFQFSIKTNGVAGRNWGVLKQHIIEVNGFDEDYIYAGVGEDVDIEWRLFANGLKRKSIRNKAIIYHLHHKRTYSEAKVRENLEMFYKKQKMDNIKCLNGIENIKA